MESHKYSDHPKPETSLVAKMCSRALKIEKTITFLIFSFTLLFSTLDNIASSIEGRFKLQNNKIMKIGTSYKGPHGLSDINLSLVAGALPIDPTMYRNKEYARGAALDLTTGRLPFEPIKVYCPNTPTLVVINKH